MSGRQRLLLFSTKRMSVCLRNKEYYFSATRKSSPNPSYLHSGEFVLVWDPKNRSSHTQIVHIEILRAQMYLKSDETEGTPPSEHMDIFAENRLWVRRGVERCLGGTMCQNHSVFSIKVARATIPSRRDDIKCHQVRSLRTKVDGGTGRRIPSSPTGSLSRPSEPHSDKSVWGISSTNDCVRSLIAAFHRCSRLSLLSSCCGW